MKGKSLVLATVFLLAITMASVSCAQRGRGGDDRTGASQPGEFHLVGTIPDILLLDFNLTADQAAKIAALRDNLLQEIRPLQEKMKFEQDRQKRQYGDVKNIDNPIVPGPSGTHQLLQGMVNDKRTKYLLDVSQILTPEQQALLNRTMRGSGSPSNKRGQDMDGERGGPGGGGGMGGPGGGPGGGGMGGPGGGRSGW